MTLLETDRHPAHHPVPEVPTIGADWRPFLDAAGAVPPGLGVGEDLVAIADRARPLLPARVHRALDDHLTRAGAGAVVVHGVPTGSVPPTPHSPTTATTKDLLSELVLLTVARTLGEPVGYAPEHGGALVQNLLPTKDGTHRQTSTSSAVELEFHTETGFHPYRPRHLLLLGLRGDPTARTFVCAVDEVLDHLPPAVRRTLHEPRFRTRVDESFGGSPDDPPGPLVSVLSGDPSHPTLLFDAPLMSGEDAEAEAALDVLRSVARARRLALVLNAGDLLVVDNDRCIHGRSAFTARHDGTDRWLQRTFVVDDLEPSAAERSGRIITTSFP
jgi:L-asparagine oxygenase